MQSIKWIAVQQVWSKKFNAGREAPPPLLIRLFTCVGLQ